MTERRSHEGNRAPRYQEIKPALMGAGFFVSNAPQVVWELWDAESISDVVAELVWSRIAARRRD